MSDRPDPAVVAWRALWIVPVMASRLLFCGLIGITYGSRDMRRAWRATQ